MILFGSKQDCPRSTGAQEHLSINGGGMLKTNVSTAPKDHHWTVGTNVAATQLYFNILHMSCASREEPAPMTPDDLPRTSWREPETT